MNLDADLHNADWTKQTFDFPDIDSMAEFVEMLEGEGRSLELFMELPAYQLAKEKGTLPDWWDENA